MTTSIAVLPYSNSVNATVEMRFNTVVNESEGGFAVRKSITTLKRIYTLTIGPDTAEEVMKIALGARGSRWPVCLRDYAANYKFVNEPQYPLDQGGGVTAASLQRVFAPSTGGRAFIQRVLFVDLADAFTVNVNGSPMQSGWHIADYGLLVFDTPVSPSATITVSGSYLIPVVFQDDGVTMTLHTNETFSIQNVHFREILETELTALLQE